MCQCVSGVSRWGDNKGGWRDHEGDEESVPMLSQVILASDWPLTDHVT